MNDNASDLITSGFNPAQYALMKELMKRGTATAGSSPQFNPLSAGSYSGQTFSAPIPIVDPGLIDYGTINAANAARKAMAMAATEQTFPNIAAPVFDVEAAKELGSAISKRAVNKYNQRVAMLREQYPGPASFAAAVKADPMLAQIAPTTKALASAAGAFQEIVSRSVKDTDPYKRKVQADAQPQYLAWMDAIANDAEDADLMAQSGKLRETQALLNNPSAYEQVTAAMGDQFLNPVVSQIVDGTVKISDPGFETLVTGIEKGQEVNYDGLANYLETQRDVLMGQEGSAPYENFVKLYGQGKSAEKAWDNFTLAIANSYQDKINKSTQLIASWKQGQKSTKISTGGNKDKAVGYFQQEADAPSQAWNSLPEDQKTFRNLGRALGEGWKVSTLGQSTDAAILEKDLSPVAKDYILPNPESVTLLAGVGDEKGIIDDTKGARLWNYPLTTDGAKNLVADKVLVKDPNVATVSNGFTGIIVRQGTSPKLRSFFVDTMDKGSLANGSSWTKVADRSNIKDKKQYFGISSKDIQVWVNGRLYRPAKDAVTITFPNDRNTVNVLGNELYPSGSQEAAMPNFEMITEQGTGGGGNIIQE
jgi:hypothetical protein